MGNRRLALVEIVRRSKGKAGTGMRQFQNITIRRYKRINMQSIKIQKKIVKMNHESGFVFSGGEESHSRSTTDAEILRRSERQFHQDRLRFARYYRTEERGPESQDSVDTIEPLSPSSSIESGSIEQEG